MWKDPKFWKKISFESTSTETQKEINQEDYKLTLDLKGSSQIISYAHFSDENIDEKINEVINMLKLKANEFEIDLNSKKIIWNIVEEDEPSNLGEKLEARGFTHFVTAKKVGIDLQSYDINKLGFKLNEEISVELVEDEIWCSDEICDLTILCFPEFFKNKEAVIARFDSKKTSAKELGNELLNYVARINGKVVGYATSVMMGLIPNFVYLGGSATSPEYRKKGIYTALLKERIQDAKDKNMEVMYLDAFKDTSYPILEKRGFEDIEKIDIYTLEGSDLLKLEFD